MIGGYVLMKTVPLELIQHLWNCKQSSPLWAMDSNTTNC